MSQLLATPSAVEFIVMTSSAHMPQNCWGRYSNVAVVKVSAGWRPKMISTHARGVLEIVRHYGPQNMGKTSRCAFQRTVEDARQLAALMNASLVVPSSQVAA